MSANFKSSKEILRNATTTLQKEEKNSKDLNNLADGRESSLIEYNKEEDSSQSNSLINLSVQVVSGLENTSKSINSIADAVRSLNQTTKAYATSNETINALLGSSLVSLGNITSILSAFRADFIMIKNGQNINGEGYYRKELIPKMFSALPKTGGTLAKVVSDLKNSGNFANVMSNAVRPKVGNTVKAKDGDGLGIFDKLLTKFVPSGAKEIIDQTQLIPILQNALQIDDTNIATLAGSLMGYNNKKKILDPLSQWTADTLNKEPSGGRGMFKFLAAQFLQDKTGLGEGEDVAPKQREKNPNLVWSALAPYADDIKDMVKAKYEAFKKTPSFFKEKVPYVTPVWIVNSKVQKDYLKDSSTNESDINREKLKDFIKGLNTNVKDSDGNLLFKYDPVTDEFSGKLADEYLQSIGLENASYEEKLQIIKNLYSTAIDEKNKTKNKDVGTYVEKDENGNHVKKEANNKLADSLNTKEYTGLDKVTNMFQKGIYGLFDLKRNGGIKTVFNETKDDIKDIAKSAVSTFTGHKSGRKKRSKKKKNRKQQRVEIATLHEGEKVRNTEEQALQDSINHTVNYLSVATASMSSLIYLNQIKITLLNKFFKNKKVKPSDLPENNLELGFISSIGDEPKKAVDKFSDLNKKIKNGVKNGKEKDENKSLFKSIFDWFLGKEEKEDKEKESEENTETSSAEPSEEQNEDENTTENNEEEKADDENTEEKESEENTETSSAEPSEEQNEDENNDNKEQVENTETSSAEPSEEQNEAQTDGEDPLKKAEDELKDKQEKEMKDLEDKQELKLKAKKWAKEKYLWAKEKAGKVKNLAIEKAGKVKQWVIKKASKAKQRILKFKGVVKLVGKKIKNLAKKLTKRLKNLAKRIIKKLAKTKLAATIKRVGAVGGKVLSLIGKGVGAIIKAVKNIPIYGKVAALAASVAGAAVIVGGLIKLKKSIKKGQEDKDNSSKEVDKIDKKSKSKLKKAKKDADDENKEDDKDENKESKEDNENDNKNDKEDKKDGSSNPKGILDSLNKTDKADKDNDETSKANVTSGITVVNQSSDNNTDGMDDGMKKSFGKFANGQFAKSLLKNPEKGANMLFGLSGGSSILNLASKGTSTVLKNLKKATNVASSGFSGLLSSALNALQKKKTRTDDISNKDNRYSENVDLAYAQYKQASSLNDFINGMAVSNGLSEISDENGKAMFTSTVAKQSQEAQMKSGTTSSGGTSSSTATVSSDSSSSENTDSSSSSAPNRTTSSGGTSSTTDSNSTTTKKGENTNKAYKEYVLNHPNTGYYNFLMYYLNQYTDKDHKRTARMDKAFYEDITNSTPYNKLAKNKNNFDSKLQNSLDKSVFGKGIVRGVNGKGFTNNQMVNEFLDASSYALNNNYKEKDGGTYPNFFKDYLNKNNIDVNSTGSNKEILNSLKQGNPVILMGKDSSNSGSTPYGSEPHYVVATGYDGKNITVEDSESKTGSTVYNANQVLSHSNIKMTTNNNGKSYSNNKRTFSRHYSSPSTIYKTNFKNSNYFKSGKAKYGKGYNETIQSNPDLLQGAKDGWTMYGILASITLAQAIIESGFGTSNIAKNANNWFGHSYDFGSDKYKVGKYVSSTGREWAKYNSAGDSFRDHAYVLSGQSGNTRYAAAVGQSDPLKAITAIENGGYCEGNPQDYINKVMNVIQQYNLTQYDSGSFNGTAAGGSGYSNWLFCGDSRTVGLKNADSSLEVIAEVGKGYNFFISKQKEIESKTGYNIVLWFGVNDLGYISKYIDKYNEIAKNMSGKSKIIACTVGPCEDKYNDDNLHGGSGSVKKMNVLIDDFNKKLTSGLSSDISIVDLATFIKGLMSSGSITQDCLHYTNEVSKQIIDKVKSSVGTTSSGATSTATASGGNMQYLGDVKMDLSGYVDATETLSKFKKTKGIWDSDEDETSTATPNNSQNETSSDNNSSASSTTQSSSSTPSSTNSSTPTLDNNTANNIKQELNNINGNDNTPTNSLIQGDTSITDVYKKGEVTYVVNSVEYGEKNNIKEILDYFNELNTIQDDSLDVLEIIYKKLLKRKGKNSNTNIKQLLHFDLREAKTF